MSRRRGFTLVELLVVIAIIALLMSILLPAMARVKTQARNVVCQSNLKQWGVCFSMYVNNWDGYFMEGWVSLAPPPNAYKGYWMDALRTCYGNQGDLRICPMATKPGSQQGLGPYNKNGGAHSAWGVFTGAWDYAVEGDYGSYGWNGFLANPPGGKGIWEGAYKAKGKDPNWRKADTKGAALIPVLLDHRWVDCWPSHYNAPPSYHGLDWGECSQMGRFTVDRHTNGHLNYVFLDWSVRKIGLKHSWRLKWHRLFDLTFPLPTEFGDRSHWMYKFKDPE
ncbi:MAG: type II secretion system protein [Planctomycetota bacterium]|jgi:prepilin-type N-terminal cleavage/methylation domain-containing protein/prepilin-type processing-associated H-X9-DG protein